LTQTPELARRLYFEAPNYIIRTLDVGDATEGWCEWLADPRAQLNLNAKPRRMTMGELTAYIAAFDCITSHLMGIFERNSGQLVGIRVAYVDRSHRECLLNTLIGEAPARGKGAQRETRYAMHNFVFEDLDLESARASVVSENVYMLRVLGETGWVHEHTSRKPRAEGEGFVELYHFRLSRDVWRSTERAKAMLYCQG
jgi:RimJ/RimL family protein N-acetyltransferase